MATEKLILELKADVGQAIGRLEKVEKQLEDTEEKSIALSASFKKVGKSAKKMSKAALAAAAAITAIAVATAKTDRTMSNLAVTAKMSKDEFKALAFAFSQFDVDAKGAADSLNDVSERVGEFAATFAKDGKGTGAFQDFADVMGLTDTAAAAFAMTLEEMQPEDAIIRMVSAMEGANVEGSRMSFVLKSMSNDLEYTSELFRDNGRQLDDLKGGFTDMASSMALTTAQSDDLRDLAGGFDLMTASMTESASLISSTLSPALTVFFNQVTAIVPEATNAIVNFINRWRDASDLGSTISIDAQLSIQADKIAASTSRVAVAQHALNVARSDATEFEFMAAMNEEAEIMGRINELSTERIRLIEDQTAAQIELEEAGGDAELTDDQFAENLAAHQEFVDARLAQIKKAEADEIALKASTAAAKRREDKFSLNRDNDNIQSGLTVAMAANQLLFDDNKAIEAGLVVAKTGAAVMHQLGSGDPYTAFGRAAAAAAIGALQLAATLSSAKGGGSIAAVGAAPTAASEPEFTTPEGPSLAATDTSGFGGAALNITLELDGETLARLNYDATQKLIQDGVIS